MFSLQIKSDKVPNR